MTEFFSDLFFWIINDIIFFLTCFIFGIYSLLAIISAFALRSYLRKNSFVNYDTILLSPMAPHISVIAPAFNEERTIEENVLSLLSLKYANFEVIVVNDGSTDGTLAKLIERYELEKVNYFFDYHLPCERIKRVYKSKNPNYKRLMVIDKKNGGKSDSLNAGINVSRKDLICSIDADTIMEPDVLLKMVKPFMESSDEKVIGVGGVIRIANSCKIEDGNIKEINLPKEFLPRMQVLEYTRAFLLARMAWGKLNGLLLISGALGMFDRNIVVQCGGYSTTTVGEDMELVVRMRRVMAERKEKYKVVYIPDPLAWTEVPESAPQLARQRNRWTRGTIETLLIHKKLFCNPKYGLLGMLGYLYWLLFEWLAPILEFTGYVYFIFLLCIGGVNWPFFILLLIFVYTFAVFLSAWAILFEEKTFHKYRHRRDVLALLATALIEPILYHPRTVWWAIRGNIDYLRGVRAWGKMERSGFNTKPKKK